MTKGNGKTKHPFNPMQIKEGWIVRLYKDGRIKEWIEKYPPESKKKKCPQWFEHLLKCLRTVIDAEPKQRSEPRF